jgi:hypothetical protein
LNLRQLGPEPSALTRLGHTPVLSDIKYLKPEAEGKE